jgi:hypothetical protein
MSRTGRNAPYDVLGFEKSRVSMGEWKGEGWMNKLHGQSAKILAQLDKKGSV